MWLYVRKSLTNLLSWRFAVINIKSSVNKSTNLILFFILNGGFKKVYNFYYTTKATTFSWKIVPNKCLFKLDLHSYEFHIKIPLRDFNLFSKISNKMVDYWFSGKMCFQNYVYKNFYFIFNYITTLYEPLSISLHWLHYHPACHFIVKTLNFPY